MKAKQRRPHLAPLIDSTLSDDLQPLDSILNNWVHEEVLTPK